MKKLIILILILNAVPSPTLAQENTIRISPVKSTHLAQPGSTVRTLITLQNPTNKLITVTVIPRDFEANDSLDGQPRLLLDSTNTKYGLSNWLADVNLDKKITIPANQIIEYEAVFRVPFGLTPRTYFGSVTFKPETGNILGSLVFITVGNPETTLHLDSLEFGESEDATKPYGIFTSILNNSSDGLSTPQFKLKITNQQGGTVMEVTQDSEGSVLPGSRRRYTFTPSSELPDEQLTATLTATDQTGTTAGTTLQLDRAIDNKQEDEFEEIDPNKYGSTVLYGAGAILLTLVIGLIYRIKGTRNKVTD